MFYTAAWCASDESTFRREMPLDLLGDSLKRFGSGMGLYVVFLEGAERLSAGYLRSLEDRGLVLVDHSTAFGKIVAAYPNLGARYSRYERNCLLRWIAFRELLEGHPDKPAQFWHLDGDVVLHTSLEELARDTAGKTFLLQGCPALLTVSDPGWFDIYEAHLKMMEKDLTEYSAAAAAEKLSDSSNDYREANYFFYRNPIGSDQDLLRFLVSSGRLPQDERSVIYRSRYFFIENPLTFNLAGSDVGGEGKAIFRMTAEGKIRNGEKLVPFMHYQNDFARYAQLFLLLKRWKVPSGVVRRLMRYHIEEERFIKTFWCRILSRLWFGLHPSWGRRRVIERLNGRLKGQTPADLLNFLTLYTSLRK